MAESEQLIKLIENADLINLAWLVIIIPFITGGILLFLRVIEIKRSYNRKEDFKFSENLTGSIGVAGLAGSLIMSLVVAVQYAGIMALQDENISHPVIRWVVGDFQFLPTDGGAAPFKWGIALSPLSVIMMVLLAVIAFVIHLYATEYMHADSAYTRFFGTFNFFTGSMFGFVLASNLFMAFIFWELLGFASYLLIGYYWPKASASSAAKKAFLYNKVGDVSFMIGIALIWAITNDIGHATLDYFALREMTIHGELSIAQLWLPGLLIFGGAVGKSAQLPLLGWLPEAMEGPTPVSALLHSSTMVKAGLFLTARIFFMFFKVDDQLKIVEWSYDLWTPNIIAWVGTLTALAGGLMALTADDLKKVLAFSTISQLGYIGLALGAGGLTASFFHLISHATFKSLLFLGAGAVIHAIHKPHAYMSKLGGLRHELPHTYKTMLIGLLALAGVPLMSGFWSKDAVLLAMEESHIVGHVYLFWIAVFTAGVTAFYSTKMLVLTFWGEPRYDPDEIKIHKPGKRTVISLWIIAGMVLLESIWWTISIGGGGTLTAPNDKGGKTALLGNYGKNFEYFLGSLLGQHQDGFAVTLAVPSTLAVVIGIGLALALYKYNALTFLQTNPVSKWMYSFASDRFKIDKTIYWIAESPVMMTGEFFQKVDKEFIDEIVINGIVTGGAHAMATASDSMDKNIVDGFVKMLEKRTKGLGKYLRKFQNGQTPNYALLMAVGLSLVLTGYSVFYLFV